jgi:hypothetical protein
VQIAHTLKASKINNPIPYTMSRIINVSSKTLIAVLVGSLTLAAQFVGVSNVFASGYVTLNSFSGTPGSSIIVSGGGFTPGDTINISSNGSAIVPAVVDSSSNFSATFQIPVTAKQGPLTISGTDTATNETETNSYYVVPLSAAITVVAPSHSPYAVATVSGTGYAPGEGITIALGGATASSTANSAGAFTGTITVPQVASQLYLLTATGNSSGASALNYFWIDTFYPSVSPTSYYLAPAGTLSFNGSGFASSEMVNVTQTGTTTILSSFTTDPTGSFTGAGSFALPAMDHGKQVTFTLTGTKSGQSASTNVTVGDYYAYVSPTSYYLLPGQSETFTGGGYGAGEVVDVFVGASTTPATKITADKTGSFTAAGSVAVPFGSTKAVSFTLTGEGSGASSGTSIAVGTYFPSVSPSNYYVTPNTSITLSGSGFAPSEVVTISASKTASSTQVTTTAMGTFSAPVVIPFGSTGTVTAIGAMSQSQTAVTVQLAKFFPSISPSSWYNYPGQTITYTGSGFVPGETVTVVQGTASSTTVTANSLGGFTTASSTVPVTKTGLLTATFTGALSQSRASITTAIGALSPYLSSDLYSTVQGGTVHITGYSFAAGEMVTVTAGSFSTTTVTNANGTTPAVAVPAPYNASSLTVTFTGASSGVSSNITIGLQSFNALISASTYFAQPGSSVTITGTGFSPNETVNVTGGTSTSTATATSLGAFSTSVQLPYGQSATKIVATGSTSKATASLSIAYSSFTALVSPSAYYTTPGTTEVLSGSGFAPNEVVAVTFNGASVGTTTASAMGTFGYNYQIPYNASKAVFTFTGNTSGASASVSVSLAAFSSYITLSNYYAQGGTPLTISGTGFASGETVVFSVPYSTGSKAFASTTASAMGTFTYVGKVPYAPAGSQVINATGLTSAVVAGASYTEAPVYAGLMLGSYAGKPGSAVDFIGSGYLPNEPVEVSTDRSSASYLITANSSGSFNDSGFVIPANFTEGNLTFTVKGLYSYTTETIVYYVTGN